MTISRLSPYNISNDLYRALLYKDIREGSENNVEDFEAYEIKLDEIKFPELISYRHYGTKELKWVVCVIAKLDDWRELLTSGEILMLPTKSWVRKKIKYYEELYG